MLLHFNFQPHRGRGWLEFPSGFGSLSSHSANVLAAQVRSLRGDCLRASDCSDGGPHVARGESAAGTRNHESIHAFNGDDREALTFLGTSNRNAAGGRNFQQKQGECDDVALP